MEISRKLAILADAAKYDASCASSSAPKRNSLNSKGIGSTEGAGICHAYAPDGRCNAVKHFKYEPRGKRRLHKKPNNSEIDICRWWLDIERKLVQPELIVALGATAARGVLGKTVTIGPMRGKVFPLSPSEHVLITVHPSYLLRIVDQEQKKTEWRTFLADLMVAKSWLDLRQPA